jgi:PTH1 family peptidyl-tRNA hydrolase
MAWLQKKPQVSDSIPYYSMGLNKTKLIVGLGNYSPEYDSTRHNIGFEAATAFVSANSEFESWVNKKDLKCLLSSGKLGSTRVIVIKPTTFMNLAGEAVQAVANFYKIHPKDITVIQDELDLRFGQIRMQTGGTSAGHNGIKSIIGTIGDDFGRIRIGIGPKLPIKIDSADFVLQRFSSEQQSQMSNLLCETNSILSECTYGELPKDTRSFLV